MTCSTLPYDRRCMHEFVVSATPLKEHGVRALDVAKRLLDYGVHPPTTYFPLIVDEALMVEPTETESREDLDRLVAAFCGRSCGEAATEPELLREAPLTMPVRRLDEAEAARQPVLRSGSRKARRTARDRGAPTRVRPMSVVQVLPEFSGGGGVQMALDAACCRRPWPSSHGATSGLRRRCRWASSRS